MTSPGLPGAGTGLGVQAAPFLESTESGVISSRVARGSTIERQPAAPTFRFVQRRSRLPTRANACHTSAMKTARKKPTAAKLRSWRVIIIMGSRGELLGYVEALDRERAEVVAIKQLIWTRSSSSGC